MNDMPLGGYPGAAIERAMKIQEVIMRVYSGQLEWWQAAEILRVSSRTMRRWKERYERKGYDGIFDRRRRRPSPRRVPVEQVRRVLELYRERYHDFNVKHFHQMLQEHHGIGLSYQWVKSALQAAGLVARKARRGSHRQHRERRPLPGMMLFVDGSSHCWIPALAPAHQDLILWIDDATGRAYDAELVPEEGTLPVMRGLRRIIESQGLFCSLYTDRGEHFFHTPKASGPVDRHHLTQIGRALMQLGIEHIPSYSPQARGRMERFFGSWQGRLPQELRLHDIQNLQDANRYIRKHFLPSSNKRWSHPPREEGSAFVPCANADLDSILSIHHERTVAADNTVSFNRISLQIPPSRFRWSFAKCRVTLCEHLDASLSIRFGPHLLARYRQDGAPLNLHPIQTLAA